MNHRKKSTKLKIVIPLILICCLVLQSGAVYAQDCGDEPGMAGTGSIPGSITEDCGGEDNRGGCNSGSIGTSDYGTEDMPETENNAENMTEDNAENMTEGEMSSGGEENLRRMQQNKQEQPEEGATECRDISLSFRASAQSAASDSAVSIRVYKGAFTDEEAPKRYGSYYLEKAEAGDVFTYRLYSEGCYIYYRADVITEEDIRAGYKNISYTMDRRSGAGYEAKTVYRWPEAFEEKFFDAGNLTGADRSVLDTPAFDAGKAAHQFTSVEEGCEYLQNLCSRSSLAHLYYLEGNMLCPVVILTTRNLSSADTLDEAISKLSDGKKMKVMYQAQIHGNEPASGEGALAVCRGLSQNKTLLSGMDVVIVPYVNPRGSRNFTRSNGSGININRDALQLQSEEAQNLHRLFSRLMPEIFIDGHEFIGKNLVSSENGEYVVEGMEDVKIACVENLNRGEKLFSIERKIAENLVKGLPRKGFRTSFYPANWDSTTSCSYARMNNCLAFLIETNGIGNGKLGMERRVLAHYESVLSILNRAAAKKTTIVSAVKKARNDLIQAGKRYDKSRRFVLSHEASLKDPESAVRPVYDFLGRYVSEDRVSLTYNRAQAVKSRSRPTAYILSASSSGAEEVKRVLSISGASYFELKAGTKLSVTRYIGNSRRAGVTKRRTVSFPKGAVVFFMDQPSANIIAASFEPDAADSAEYEGSFVQSGVIEKFRKGYPIYRYSGRNPQKSLAKYKKGKKDLR